MCLFPSRPSPRFHHRSGWLGWTGRSTRRGSGRAWDFTTRSFSNVVEEAGSLSDVRTSEGSLDDQTSNDEWYRNTLQSRLEEELAKICAESSVVRAVVQATLDLVVTGALV